MHDRTHSRSTLPTSQRIALDGGHADVDLAGENVEVTARIGERGVIGLALTASEAQALGEALLAVSRTAWEVQATEVDLSGVHTVCDLMRRADSAGVPAAALMGRVQA